MDFIHDIVFEDYFREVLAAVESRTLNYLDRGRDISVIGVSRNAELEISVNVDGSFTDLMAVPEKILPRISVTGYFLPLYVT